MDAMMYAVAEGLAVRSAECERGIIAIGADPITGEPVAALALIAPQCVLFTKPLDSERGIFLDICLN